MKNKFFSCGIICLLVQLATAEAWSQTISSTVGGGAWSAKTTWIGSVVPGVNNDVEINGTVDVNVDVTVRSISIAAAGILQNTYNTHPTVTASVAISNNGKILLNPGYYSGFVIATPGNIMNNGIWWPSWTTFTGAGTKEISAGSGKRFQGNFQSLDSMCTIKAKSDIAFAQAFDLKKGTLDMQTFALTLAGSGNVRYGKVTNTKDLILIEGAAISDITYSGSMNLKGLVQIYLYSVAMEGTVTVVDTLQNAYNSHPTLPIKGTLINNGVIRLEPGYYSGFAITVTKAIVNNGIWAPNTTIFTGGDTKEITLATGKRFQGNFQNTDSASTITAKSNLLFTGSFDLKKSTLNMQNYTLTLAGAGNVTQGRVINTKDVLVIEGAAISGINYVGAPNLLGLFQVNGDDVILEGNVTISDTLTNVYQSHPTIYIKGNLVNNGVIRLTPGYYSGFAISTSSNITNNGTWGTGWTYFTGPSVKEITLLAGKKFQCNFQNADSSAIIRAKSTIVLTNPFDLKKGTMDMASFALTLSGSANIYGGKVINTKDLFVNEGAVISSITYSGLPNLRGLVQINGDDVVFEGNVTITDTILNVVNGHPTVTIKGSLVNNGAVLLNPGYYSGFAMNVSLNYFNTGKILSTSITLNGTTDQTVMFAGTTTIKNRFILDSKLGGTGFKWYKNGVILTGDTSGTYRFDSVGTTNIGKYQCTSSSGSSRYFTVQSGTINVVPGNTNGDVELPGEYVLSQNYPNPFNPSTRIEYTLKNTVFTVIKVYSVLGNEIRTLVNGEKAAGNHSVVFDASGLSSGIYFYAISAGSFIQTRTMLLLK